MGKVQSKRKASGKTVKRRKVVRRKVVATIKDPNIQSTKRDPKQNVVAAIK